MRSIKSLARELQQQQGLTAAKAAKLAAQQLTGGGGAAGMLLGPSDMRRSRVLGRAYEGVAKP